MAILCAPFVGYERTAVIIHGLGGLAQSHVFIVQFRFFLERLLWSKISAHNKSKIGNLVGRNSERIVHDAITSAVHAAPASLYC